MVTILTGTAFGVAVLITARHLFQSEYPEMPGLLEGGAHSSPGTY